MAGNVRNIFTDPKETEDLTKKEFLRGIQSQFPMENKQYRLEVNGLYVDPTPVSKQEEKDALLKSRSVTRLVKGNMRLIDKATGKVVDEVKDFSFADFYPLTDKHTMIYRGNNYSMANLIQLMPGAYTRSKKDGELETHINTGSGRSLSIQLDPQKGQFTMMADGSQSRIPIAPVLKEIFQVSDLEASKYVPADVWMDNLAVTPRKVEASIDSLYDLVVSKAERRPGVSYEDKKLAIRNAFESSSLAPATTEITLGKAKSNVDKEVFLASMKNIVDVHRGEREEDHRDSLEFKRVQSLPDFIRDRFAKEDESVKKVKSRMAFTLERINREDPKIRGVVPVKPFKDVFSNVIVRSNLSSTPTETNPLESLENVGKATFIAAGEGGMQSSRAADFNTKSLHPSQLGILDPSRTPQSDKAGLDLRFTMNAMRDDDGILYTSVVDAKSGEKTALSAAQMMRSVVGFPHQKGSRVYAQVRGKIQEVNRSQVQYWLPDGSSMYTVTTNMVPFLNSDHPGRLTMASNALTQALSLEDREAPLVQTVSESGNSLVQDLGRVISTRASVDGVVEKVDSDKVVIKDESGKRHNIPLIRDMPFNMKGFHDDTPTVTAGQKVSADDIIADNTYTQGGSLALGKNLVAAYMPYKGYNHEDGIVVSRSAANKMRSNHAYKYDYALKRTTKTDLALFKRYFPSVFTQTQLSKLDSKGFVKKGQRVVFGDPIYALLEPNTPSEYDKALGRLHKSLVDPYRKVVEVWEHNDPGEVIEVSTDTRDIRVLVRSVKTLEEGDKVTGLHGNKGVVSLILEDEAMPRIKETGEPVDLILNPASVTSRVNLGQLMETAAAKVAKKTGTPYLVRNFESENTLKALKQELAKHGLKDTESLVDPVTGKDIGEVLTGPQYFLKLNKTSDQNYSARSVGKYDQYMQPVKGGSEGAKAVGVMEFLGLLGSNARENLREIGTVKAEKNEEYWHKFMTGQPLPKPTTTFATKRLFDTLRGSGVKVDVSNEAISASPLTDHDILGRSNGAINNALLVNSKDASPEKGGLFDTSVTGGLTGDKWSHFRLAEPVVNPTFEKPVRNLLGLTQAEFDKLTSGEYKSIKRAHGVFDIVDGVSGRLIKTINVTQGFQKKASENSQVGASFVGGQALEAMLKDLDVNEALKTELSKFNSSTSMDKKNTSIKRMKYLKGLQQNGFSNAADAYMLHNVPVIPPTMRPVIDQGGNRLEYADVNVLYKESILAQDALNSVKDYLTDDMLVGHRKESYNSVKAILGLGESTNYKSRKEGRVGLLKQVGGVDSPKSGMYLSKILKRKQDFSGRATIHADPDLGFNEAAIPEAQLWTMYKLHIIRKLGQHGFTLAEAKTAYDNKEMAAVNVFNQLIKEVPVLLNRAPTLMRTNIMGVMPKPSQGTTIGLNPLHLPAFAADYDGDALSMYLPMTPEAVREAKEKLLPVRHMSDARKGYGIPMFAPGHEAILGSVHLTEPDMTQKIVKFKTEEEALQALKSGKIKDNTPIQITG